MKPNTPDLMKFKRLQRRLGVSVPQLVGHLELLWIATAKNAPEGDIGRFTNEDIAIACHWDDDPDTFVHALVECGWLDESEEWRLLVHDWAVHAPSWIEGNLKRHGRSFRKGGRLLEEPTMQPTMQPPIAACSEQRPTIPNLTIPNLTQPQPDQTKPPAADWSVRWSSSVVDKDFVETVVETANRYARLRRKIDRDLIWQCCWVGCEFDRSAVLDACDSIRSGSIEKPEKYLSGMMRNLCKEHGEDWTKLRALVPSTPPPSKSIAQGLVEIYTQESEMAS